MVDAFRRIHIRDFKSLEEYSDRSMEEKKKLISVKGQSESISHIIETTTTRSGFPRC